MKEIERILVAVDLDRHEHGLTPGSRRAVELVRKLAPVLGARVILLHDTAEDEQWDLRVGDYIVVPPGLAEAARATLDAVAAELRGSGIAVSVETPSEGAWLAVTKRVLREPIGLVVAGKRNRPDASRQRIGSVSTKLVRKCPCAVWVVKPGGDAIPRRILAASDGGDVGSQVVRYAGFLGEHLAAEVHVVHALQLPMAVQLEGDASQHEFERRRCAELAQAFEQQLAEGGYAGKPSFEMGIGAPTSAILKTEERIDPDLVVMGTVSRGGIAGVLVGNTAERLLDRLDCSLLTVKPADFVCPVEPG